MPTGYVGEISASQGDGAALTASTTRTNLLAGQGIQVYGAGALRYIGQSITCRAYGRISTVTTPGTLTLDIALGSVVVAASGALTLSSTAKTNVSWFLDWELDLRTLVATVTPATASFMHMGRLYSEAVGATTVAGLANVSNLPVSVPAVGNTFDPTAAASWGLFATWGTSNANSIQCHSCKFFSND